jgi:reactive intermediate/imine deaminase
MKTPVITNTAPPPAGTYHQGIVTQGKLLFISGQTPRTPDGTRLGAVPFAEQATRTLDNLLAVTEAAEYDLKKHAVKVTVYLKNLDDRIAFDAIFARYVGDIPPARTIVQSNFVDFDIEVDAILAM